MGHDERAVDPGIVREEPDEVERNEGRWQVDDGTHQRLTEDNGSERSEGGSRDPKTTKRALRTAKK